VLVTDATGGRRELRKAQTRAEVRATAQRLFAERGFDAVTIADVAAAADVAVQTVFNHFESKEALFFDGRTPWVEGTAAAVSQRAPGTDPVGALRRYLEQDLAHVLHQESRPENRGYVEVLENSAGLQSRERMLVELAGLRAAEELAEAIATGGWDAAPTADPATAHVLSRLIADLFLVAGRALVLENRRLVLHPDLHRTRHHSVATTTPITLAAIERCVRGLAAQLLTEPA
jgi:AcrR family transcriptional regulator